MRPVVFYRRNGMSLRIFANGGTSVDIKVFHDCVFNFIKNENDCSNSESSSRYDSKKIEYEMFLDKIITSKISLDITEDGFERLISFLRNIYYVYED